MTQTLRPYQERGVAEIRASYAGGARRVLYQAPTGSGKTVLFAYIVHGAVERGNTVCILGHRQEIVDQISAALADLDVPHGLIAAGHPETEAPVQVASVASLVRRLHRALAFDLLVIDECHHAVAGTWGKILEAYPEAKALGVTATPERLDGAGLGNIFDTLIAGPTVVELIGTGFLSPFTAYMPAKEPDLEGVRSRAGDFAVEGLARAMGGVVIGDAVSEYKRLCSGASAIAFCVDIAHSRQVAARFEAAGYKAAHVDGETPSDARRALIAALGSGELQILCNCGLISEGVDVPTVSAAILLRPTKSLALYLQQVGRVLRPAPGKERALILDHSGNVLRFGLPDSPRAWSLEGGAAADAKAAGERFMRCENCAAINRKAAIVCKACGSQLYKPIIREEIHSSLVEVDVDRLRALPYRRAVAWAGADERRLRAIAAARGYKPGWVWHRLQALRGEASA